MPMMKVSARIQQNDTASVLFVQIHVSLLARAPASDHRSTPRPVLNDAVTSEALMTGPGDQRQERERERVGQHSVFRPLSPS